MISSIRKILQPITHLFYPHYCLGCAMDLEDTHQVLCFKCIHQLPSTGFIEHANNLVEKLFIGRLELEEAAAAFYFTPSSMVQQLMIELKYKGNQQVGIFLGQLIAQQILQSGRFKTIDAIVPVPLNAKKEKMRGYNQAALIAKGISEILHWPVLDQLVQRTVFTNTQTVQNRSARWQNMDGVFQINPNIAAPTPKHILLIDDVVTTGATLEACGKAILELENTKLSVLTAAYTL